MNEIQQFLHDKWAEPYGIGLMPPDDAMHFVNLCMKHNVRISGFDGFHRRPDVSRAAIQIDQQFSANYSNVPRDRAYALALEYFSAHKGDGVLYQVIYEYMASDYDIVQTHKSN